VTDILIIFLLLLSLPPLLSFPPRNSIRGKLRRESSSFLKSKIYNLKSKIFFCFLFSVFCFLNFSHLSPISLIKSLKLLEIFAFAWLTKNYLSEDKKNLSRLLFVLSLSLLFQSSLAIAQFLNHGAINGVFYWFGERSFTAQTPGIANAAWNGTLVLRPYGTLPHPNVLAGFLLIGIILLLSFLRRQESYSWQNSRNNRSRKLDSSRSLPRMELRGRYDMEIFSN
jgi:hypothetical protein